MARGIRSLKQSNRDRMLNTMQTLMIGFVVIVIMIVLNLDLITVIDLILNIAKIIIIVGLTLLFIYINIKIVVNMQRDNKLGQKISILLNLISQTEEKRVFPISSIEGVKYAKIMPISLEIEENKNNYSNLKIYDEYLFEVKINPNKKKFKRIEEEITKTLSDLLLLNSDISYLLDNKPIKIPKILDKDELKKYKELFPEDLKPIKKKRGKNNWR